MNSAPEFDDMRDALAHAEAMSDYREGREEALTLEEVDARLAEWGMTQAALAESTATTQPHVADLESGEQGGSLEIMARIAKALNVKVDDLVHAGRDER